MKRTSKILDELHRVRERMHKETQGLSFAEKIRYWNSKIDKALSKDGYTLDSKGRFKILRKV